MNLKLLFFIIIFTILYVRIKFPIENFDNLKSNNINNNKKIAVCFFGLTRSLKHTIDSIKKNIFHPLQKNNINYDIYLHTYDLKYLKLKRSAEDSKLDTNEWKLLKPDYLQIDNQDKFDGSFNYEEIFKYGDFWDTKFENTKNLIRQLNSIQKLWSLIEKNKKKYDAYLFLRPDLKYVKPINIDNIKSVISDSNLILTPIWHKSGGLNDRLALGKYNSMKLYANRIDKVKDYLKKSNKPLHAESFLKYIIDTSKIKNNNLNLVGQRIRCNGHNKDLDLK